MKIEVVEVKPVPPPKEYVLILSNDEAHALRRIAYWIARETSTGPVATLLRQLNENFTTNGISSVGTNPFLASEGRAFATLVKDA